MAKQVSLEELWNTTARSESIFEPGQVAGLPKGAQRYLLHAISAGIKLASAVHLRMHGEIKLRGWLPFTAEEVLHRDRGFIWAASVPFHGLPIRGFDRLLDGEGVMKWKLAGILPVTTASGPDITRSAIGRFQAESVWLPSMLFHDDVLWTAQDALHAHGHFMVRGEPAEIDVVLDGQGRIITLKLPRWGNPDGSDYRNVEFGMIAEEERTFDGYTIPARIRAGWYFGSGRFQSEGEFFRATIDEAEYR